MSPKYTVEWDDPYSGYIKDTEGHTPRLKFEVDDACRSLADVQKMAIERVLKHLNNPTPAPDARDAADGGLSNEGDSLAMRNQMLVQQLQDLEMEVSLAHLLIQKNQREHATINHIGDPTDMVRGAPSAQAEDDAPKVEELSDGEINDALGIIDKCQIVPLFQALKDELRAKDAEIAALRNKLDALQRRTPRHSLAKDLGSAVEGDASIMARMTAEIAELKHDLERTRDERNRARLEEEKKWKVARPNLQPMHDLGGIARRHREVADAVRSLKTQLDAVRAAAVAYEENPVDASDHPDSWDLLGKLIAIAKLQSAGEVS